MWGGRGRNFHQNAVSSYSFYFTENLQKATTPVASFQKSQRKPIYEVVSSFITPSSPSAIDLIPQTATVMPHSKQQPDTEHSIPTTPSTAAGSYEPGAYMAHPGHASTHHTCCLLQLCVNIFGDFPRCLSTPSSALPRRPNPSTAPQLCSPSSPSHFLLSAELPRQHRYLTPTAAKEDLFRADFWQFHLIYLREMEAFTK